MLMLFQIKCTGGLKVFNTVSCFLDDEDSCLSLAQKRI